MLVEPNSPIDCALANGLAEISYYMYYKSVISTKVKTLMIYTYTFTD